MKLITEKVVITPRDIKINYLVVVSAEDMPIELKSEDENCNNSEDSANCK